ncbi:hypothetical protein [Luteipulveratus mongoliensis]|nr:hypothetical protein [Luteipulveratus mongoliensis]
MATVFTVSGCSSSGDEGASGPATVTVTSSTAAPEPGTSSGAADGSSTATGTGGASTTSMLPTTAPGGSGPAPGQGPQSVAQSYASALGSSDLPKACGLVASEDGTGALSPADRQQCVQGLGYVLSRNPPDSFKSVKAGKATVTGDRATISWTPADVPWTLIRIKGRWYMEPDTTIR